MKFTSNACFKSINPSNEQIIDKFEFVTHDEAIMAVERSQNAFLDWKTKNFTTKTALLHRASELLTSRKEEYSRLMSEEMGKPLIQAVAEVEKCAVVCEYYAKNGERFLSDETIETDATRSYITYQPLGAVLAIMPWNFPFWQVLRFAVPTLLSGNVCLLKHAPNVPGCALAIQKLLNDAGFPDNVFQTIFLNITDVQKIIEHPTITGVTLTGSTAAGMSVAEIAGRNLKKTVMELGGSDPYLVLEDADLEKTIASCVTGRMINSGQSCIAAKRYIVVESIRKEFEESLTEKFKKITYGNPLEGNFDIGPLARRDLRDQLHNQLPEVSSKGPNGFVEDKFRMEKDIFIQQRF